MRTERENRQHTWHRVVVSDGGVVPGREMARAGAVARKVQGGAGHVGESIRASELRKAVTGDWL